MFIKQLLDDPLVYLRVVVIVIVSISLHELSHGFMAITQGDDTPKKTGHMTLDPIIHMGVPSIIFLLLTGISWGLMPVNPAKFRHGKLSNILVSAAGPLCNLLLSVLFVFIYEWIKLSNAPLSKDFFLMAAIVNFSLFIWNLLPIPPLDGFHVFSEIFPVLKPLEESSFASYLLFGFLFFGDFGESFSYISNLFVEYLIQTLPI